MKSRYSIYYTTHPLHYSPPSVLARYICMQASGPVHMSARVMRGAVFWAGAEVVVVVVGGVLIGGCTGGVGAVSSMWAGLRRSKEIVSLRPSMLMVKCIYIYIYIYRYVYISGHTLCRKCTKCFYVCASKYPPNVIFLLMPWHAKTSKGSAVRMMWCSIIHHQGFF